MSGIVNKIKEAVHGDNKAHHGAPEGTAGPHNSRVANAADPRVDSDRDGSHNMMGTGHTTGHTTGRTAGHGEFGSTNPFTSSGTAEGTHGPHSSRMANAADPRVDSDRDGSHNMGAHTAGSHGFGGAATGGGLGNTIGGSHNTHGAGSGVTGMMGTHGDAAGTHGPHSSRMANVADPRVDSDRDGRGALGTAPGPAPNTAGPHKSDMMNKIDPRVDSDKDGSKTMGGNKTYQ